MRTVINEKTIKERERIVEENVFGTRMKFVQKFFEVTDKEVVLQLDELRILGNIDSQNIEQQDEREEEIEKQIGNLKKIKIRKKGGGVEKFVYALVKAVMIKCENTDSEVLEECCKVLDNESIETLSGYYEFRKKINGVLEEKFPIEYLRNIEEIKKKQEEQEETEKAAKQEKQEEAKKAAKQEEQEEAEKMAKQEEQEEAETTAKQEKQGETEKTAKQEEQEETEEQKEQKKQDQTLGEFWKQIYNDTSDKKVSKTKTKFIRSIYFPEQDLKYLPFIEDVDLIRQEQYEKMTERDLLNEKVKEIGLSQKDKEFIILNWENLKILANVFDGCDLVALEDFREFNEFNNFSDFMKYVVQCDMEDIKKLVAQNCKLNPVELLDKTAQIACFLTLDYSSYDKDEIKKSVEKKFEKLIKESTLNTLDKMVAIFYELDNIRKNNMYKIYLICLSGIFENLHFPFTDYSK